MRFLAAALLFATTPILSAADLDSTVIDRTVATALQRWHVPGAVIAVVQSDRAFVSGHGVKKLGAMEPPTPTTLLPLASCTKAVTTTLMAMLVDERKLDWDDPVRKHVSTFHLSEPHADALVTLRDLVSHRTGVKGHDLLWYHAPWDEDEVFRRIDRLPVERTFRGSYEYSTILFMVAGRAAQNRGEKPWADLVRERITGPLGMKSVLFSTRDPKFANADRMTGHSGGTDGRITPVPFYETDVPNSAGSIHLSGEDFVPWLKFHLAGGVHAGRALVSKESLAETKRPLNPLPMEGNLRRMNPDTVQMTYAMGWLAYDYRGHAVVAHGGMIDGFRVQVSLFPQDNLGIAIVNNLHETKMNQAVTNNLADRALGLPPKDWDAVLLDAVKIDAAQRAAEDEVRRKARRAKVPPSFAAGDYAGKYIDPAYGEAEIRVEKGQLVWRWSSFVVGIEHWEGDVFRFTSGFLEDRMIGFRVGKNGPTAFAFEGRVFEKKE
ncbi:serine hydrolase [Limnoglobus roseus]|uniref:Serine hydrolase n=1 Tax=Limnoglobus roseus TaxID=2598579 RepID=A0A5C1AMK3_9BACT|nr:serine hydrolase [Limnoglobus roseus]QEL18962.1 serine hydrolase [Limnoglobus roseus]